MPITSGLRRRTAIGTGRFVSTATLLRRPIPITTQRVIALVVGGNVRNVAAAVSARAMPGLTQLPETHQVLEEGNRTPREIVELLAAAHAKEPPPARGRRVALGLTLLREVDAKVALRWFQLLRSHWWSGPVFNARAQYVVQARNLVLKQAFDDLDSWDDLLFWDADQVPPLWVPALPKIEWEGGWFTDYLDFIAATQLHKTVIGGLYFSREDYWQTDQLGQVKAGPHEPVAYWGNVGEATYRYLSLQEIVPMLQQRGIYRVMGCGTGCMLIRKQTLLELAEAKLPNPVFEAPTIMPGEKGGLVGSQWTEDLRFCHEIQTMLGQSIWLDTAMESAHVAEIWITSAHYLESRGIQTQPHPQSLKNAGRPQQPEGSTGSFPQRPRIWTPTAKR